MQPYNIKDFTQFLMQGQTSGPAVQENGQGMVGIPAAGSLAISVDSLVAGVHFPKHTPTTWIAHKSLAVNLSDLAAMGARPAWYSLGLVLPEWDEDWLHEFRAGLQALSHTYGLGLMACNLAVGPLSITIQVYGWMAREQAALKRSVAQAGDRIFVSGSLGDASCALEYEIRGRALPERSRDYLLQRLHRPDPRLELGQALVGIANAAIDISDGFLADLGHILEESNIGARVVVESLPCSDALLQCSAADRVLDHVLGGGDDYELCFTVPANKLKQLHEQCAASGLQVHEVGEIVQTPGLMLMREGKPWSWSGHGYEHFRSGGQDA